MRFAVPKHHLKLLNIARGLAVFEVLFSRRSCSRPCRLPCISRGWRCRKEAPDFSSSFLCQSPESTSLVQRWRCGCQAPVRWFRCFVISTIIESPKGPPPMSVPPARAVKESVLPSRLFSAQSARVSQYPPHQAGRQRPPAARQTNEASRL